MAITTGTESILEAASYWKLRSLLGDQSVFSSELLWTREIAFELQRDFVDKPDEGDGGFLDKLKGQLTNSSPQAKRLAAEMLWVLWLFPSKISRDLKLGQVREVWSWSGSSLPENVLLEQALESGIGGAGQAYLQLQWAELAFLIEFIQRWKSLPRAEREKLLDHPWEFAENLDSTPGAPRRQFRHMLLHLLFPETFERIASGTERRKVVRSFAHLLGDKTLPDLSDSAMPLPMDKALSELRQSLSEQYPGVRLDYYVAPLRELWKEPPSPPEGTPTQIQDGLIAIMANYQQARSSEGFSGSHPITLSFEKIRRGLQESAVVRKSPTLRVEWSIGKGNWSRVPWIALMDTRETTTTRKGVYCVWLFRQDMTGVYLTLNQGVRKPQEELGRAAANEYLHRRASEIRTLSPELQDAGFKLDGRIDLRASPGLGKDYEDSTIAYRFFDATMVPGDVELLKDVEAVLNTYERYLTKKPAVASIRESRNWIFQSNPTFFDLTGALKTLPVISWNAAQYADEMTPGDRVFLWESGQNAGILAIGKLATKPSERTMGLQESQFAVDKSRFANLANRVDVRIERVLQTRVLRRDLRAILALGDLSILKQAQGTNFRLAPAEAETLMSLISDPIVAPESRPDIKAISDSFARSLADCNIRFGARHEEVVKAFLVSLVTKPFVILTGLSGSGKTQLALRFGEWLGEDRLALIPVRPDWTGPEQLLGYEDALARSDDGRRPWHVPQALEFILRAAQDPANPYVLILDEMNLAHVERYFADVLSGMESKTPVLPNLRNEEGEWHLDDFDHTHIRFPDNLFLVGTVNVDETTYMFSPKVLDRANTIEFRVDSTELDANAKRPIKCNPGPSELARGFLQIATDDNWQHEHPFDELDTFKYELIRVHRLLSTGGFEFGHRVFYEAVRFASVFQNAGAGGWKDALDFQVLQKILPRLHGSRRRLEPTLSALERYCLDLTFPILQDSAKSAIGGTPILIRSHAKIARMMRNLHANQFTSFTD